MTRVYALLGCLSAVLVAAACSNSPTIAPADSGSDVADVADAAEAACQAPPDGGLQLPTPTGPYAIARGPIRTIVDPVRDETSAPALDGGLEAGSDAGDAGTGVKRKISIEISYPTDDCPTGADAPYLDGPELITLGNAYGVPWGTVKTHAKKGLPMVADQTRHPVLLFSPGYGAIPHSYTSFVEELVSHGYVVVSVSHTYWDAVTEFADGSYIVRTKVYSTADLNAEAVVWLGDQQLVLDTLSTIDANDSDGILTGRLDLKRIGSFGHSFGGATAINLLAHDQRAKAAVNLDGEINGPDNDSGGAVLASPFLLFRSDRIEDPTFSWVFSYATGPAYELVLKHAWHNNFTDFAPLIIEAGLPPDKNDFGSIDPARAVAVTNAYLVAFFDQYLAGTSEPLLTGPSSTYPEVIFAKRP